MTIAQNASLSALEAALAPAARPVVARPLRLIACGSVDDGKSTLIGRLLWDTKAVMEDQAASLMQTGRRARNDLELPDFALLLDGLQSEREQGITIDVAWRYFSTPSRSFVVADTPGHEQYTRNMVTGASNADLAILLVDARSGLLEQTRRHATVASMVGIRQFVLAVNKIDLVGYDQARFEEIAAEFRALALRLGVTSVKAVPVCAVKGENVASPAMSAMPWYSGPTLLRLLEDAPVRSGQSVGFRLPVQRVERPDESFRGYQGTVAGGSVKPGDSIVVLPSGQSATVRRIVTFDLERNAAVAGDAVTLVLDRQVDIARGDMIVSAEAPAMTGTAFLSRIVALQPEGIEPQARYWLQSASRRQRVNVAPVERLDLQSGRYEPASDLPVNGIGTARLDFSEPAIFDAYEHNRTTGGFILIDAETRNTVAAGMVLSRRDNVAGLERDGRIELSLPSDLARLVLSLEAVRERMNEIEVRPRS